MDNIELNTVSINDKIGRCESIDELKKEILPMLKSQRDAFAEKINGIIEQNNYTKVDFAKKCGVSRQTVNSWCNGSIPKNRETFIRIGMAAGYNIEEMNIFLQRVGRYSGLYSKSLGDCIYIYVVNNYDKEERLSRYDEILDRVNKKIFVDSNSADDIETVVLDKKLSDINNDSDLDRFIEENSVIFSNAYNKFFAMTNAYFQLNKETIAYMAAGQDWSASLERSVSEIRQSKAVPTRNKIISIGIHFSMGHKSIDELLSLAHMGPLYSRNLFEGVIIYILENAELLNKIPEEKTGYYGDDLCKYAKEEMSKLDSEEFYSFISELKIEGD